MFSFSDGEEGYSLSLWALLGYSRGKVRQTNVAFGGFDRPKATSISLASALFRSCKRTRLTSSGRRLSISPWAPSTTASHVTAGRARKRQVFFADPLRYMQAAIGLTEGPTVPGGRSLRGGRKPHRSLSPHRPGCFSNETFLKRDLFRMRSPSNEMFLQ